MTTGRRGFIGTASAAAAFSGGAAFAQKKYEDGVTDTEIRIGNTNPYSGPASAYAAIGKTIDAYFKGVNDAGGINGRKVKFISMDRGGSVCLNSFPGFLSGASAGVRPPREATAG